MENPLELPLPEGRTAKAEAFALDIVYGIEHEMWGPEPTIIYSDNTERWINWADNDDKFSEHLSHKWGDSIPSLALLTSNGWFNKTEGDKYTPSEKAYALLKEIPVASTASVFISYGRAQSSALAVLVKKQLEGLNTGLNVFVDSAIEVGDPWHARLEDQVKEAGYLVSLLGQNWIQNSKDNYSLITSLDSKFVRKEILWAIESDSKIYCICHNGYNLPSDKGSLGDETWKIVQKLKPTQFILVDGESAEKYEIELNKLLRKFQ